MQKSLSRHIGYSNTFDTDTSADWASHRNNLSTDINSVLTYDGANDRLSVQIKSAWCGAWLTVPFRFERGLDYTLTVNATNASAGSTLDFMLGTQPQKRAVDNANGRNNILAGSAQQIGAGQTADMAHTFTAHGDEFHLIVRFRAGSADDVFHINSVSVVQV